MTPRRVGIAASVVAALALLALLWRAVGPADDPADTARLSVDGEAEILTPDGEVELVTGDETVEFGTRVAMISGTAHLDYDGIGLELRAGVDDGPHTEVLVDRVSQLDGGDILVEASTSASVITGEGTVTVQRGAAQISSGDSEDEIMVRSYRGAAEVAVGGASSSVRALRTLSFTPAGVASGTPPIEYQPTDPWDRRFLGDAIGFGDELQRKALGLVRNLAAGTEVDAVFLSRVLPRLDAESEFRSDLIDPERDDAELLTGASIVALGRQGSFTERWESVFAFRDAGAHWGLVALDQGVNEAPALEAIDAAIGSEQLAFTTPPATNPPVTEPGPGPDGPPPTSPPPTSPPPTSPPPTSPPPTTPPPDEGPLEPVDELVDELLGDLLDGLLESGAGAGGG